MMVLNEETGLTFTVRETAELLPGEVGISYINA